MILNDITLTLKNQFHIHIIPFLHKFKSNDSHSSSYIQYKSKLLFIFFILDLFLIYIIFIVLLSTLHSYYFILYSHVSMERCISLKGYNYLNGCILVNKFVLASITAFVIKPNCCLDSSFLINQCFSFFIYFNYCHGFNMGN